MQAASLLSINNMNVNCSKLVDFLYKVDKYFPVKLSQNNDLNLLAEKWISKADFCCEIVNGNIVSAVIGYIENSNDSMAHIALFATLSEFRGKGYGKKVLNEFLNRARQKGLIGTELFCNKKNKVAIGIYNKVGFEISEDDNTTIHYICYFDRKSE